MSMYKSYNVSKENRSLYISKNHQKANSNTLGILTAKRKNRLFITALLVFSLLGFGGCASYNPTTGMYEVDPTATAIAVGTAAMIGTAIYLEHNQDQYHYCDPYPHRPCIR